MKTILILILMAGSIAANGQTYVNYKLTNFISSGGHFIATNSISVPTNTLVELLNLQGSGNITNFTAVVQYPGQVAINVPNATYVENVPTLGPLTISVTAYASQLTGNFAGYMASFNTVNQTPNLQGYAVQPNEKTATVQLQSSTDLITWNTATNGTYPATNQAAFYRLQMTVQ